MYVQRTPIAVKRPLYLWFSALFSWVFPSICLSYSLVLIGILSTFPERWWSGANNFRCTIEISLCMGSQVTPYSAVWGVSRVWQWSRALGMFTLAMLLKPTVQAWRLSFLRLAGCFAQCQLNKPFQAAQRVPVRAIKLAARLARLGAPKISEIFRVPVPCHRMSRLSPLNLVHSRVMCATDWTAPRRGWHNGHLSVPLLLTDDRNPLRAIFPVRIWEWNCLFKAIVLHEYVKTSSRL